MPGSVAHASAAILSHVSEASLRSVRDFARSDSSLDWSSSLNLPPNRTDLFPGIRLLQLLLHGRRGWLSVDEVVADTRRTGR
jgi:hypothetical protein